MANQWFKFYGGEYLSDPKILSLGAYERSCWLTLLCYASQAESGEIKFLSEAQLYAQSGIARKNAPKSILKKFEELDMISLSSNGIVTVKNWVKRQKSDSYERVKAFRERNSNVTETTEENRREKKRIEKKILDKPELKVKFFSNPIFETYKKTYPFRNYDLIFEEMCDWHLEKKGKLPQAISAFGNWLKNTKEDQALQRKAVMDWQDEQSEKQMPTSEDGKKRLEEYKKRYKIKDFN